MTTVKVISVPGNRKLEVAHSGLKNAITRGFRTGAFISGRLLVDDLRKSMSETKTGRRYRVYQGIGGKKLQRSRLHVASSARETPAVITGEFRKSIDFLVRGGRNLEFGSGSNGLAGAYAKFLEEGTSKMEARKPVGRTVEKLKSTVKTKLTVQVNKQINNLGFDVKKL